MNQSENHDSLKQPGEGKHISPSSGTVKSAVTAIHEQNARIGVTLRNILYSPADPGEQRRWYVLRATYGREVDAVDELTKSGLITYIAMRYELPYKDAPKRKWLLKPLINNILFVYSTLDEVKKYIHNVNSPESLPYLHYYYDHTRGRVGGVENVAEIPMPVMKNFILLTRKPSKDVKLITDEQYYASRLNPGQKVRITYGNFKDVEGEVIRYRHQTSVAVKMPLFGAFTTAYIPQEYLWNIPPKRKKYHTKRDNNQ